MYRFMTVVLGSTLALLAASPLFAQEKETGRPAPLDANGRFVIYSNGKDLLPYVPYGFMPEEMAKGIALDSECTDNPHITPGQDPAAPDGTPAKAETCAHFTIIWANPYWCGVGFFSGPAPIPPPPAPAVKKGWWGEDNRGWAYDLRKLKHRRVICWARGATGNEFIQLKVGILGNKRFGDTFQADAESPWFHLPKTWTRLELSFADRTDDELRRVANGVTVVVSKVQQDDPQAPATEFFLDDLYFD